MSFLEEHGIGGANLGLVRAVKVFVQNTEPTTKDKGTVWIKSATPATKTIFREYGLEPPKVEGTLWISLYDIDIKFMLERALKVFSNKKEINIEYSRENFISSMDSSKINVLKNKFMQVYSLLGTSRIYKNGKWEWLIGQYWDGTSWRSFSNLELSVYIGTTDKMVKKIAPDTGKEVWSVNNHIGAVNDVVVDKNGYIYSASGAPNAAATIGEIKKISPTGQVIWSKSYSRSIQRLAVDKAGYIYAFNDIRQLLRFSPDGERIWEINQTDFLEDIIVDVTGNVYISYSSSGSQIKKVSPGGKDIWNYSFASNKAPNLSIDSQGFIYTFMNTVGNDKATFKKVDPNGKEVATAATNVVAILRTTLNQYKNLYALHTDGAGLSSQLVKMGPDLKVTWSVPGDIKDITVDKTGNVFAAFKDSVKKISSTGQVVWTYPITVDSVKTLVVDQSPYGAFPFLWE